MLNRDGSSFWQFGVWEIAENCELSFDRPVSEPEIDLAFTGHRSLLRSERNKRTVRSLEVYLKNEKLDGAGDSLKIVPHFAY